jgi:hypothetical protein
MCNLLTTFLQDDTTVMLDGTRPTGKLWQNGGGGGGGNDGEDTEWTEIELLKNREGDKPVILNVGGKKYEVSTVETFKQSPFIEDVEHFGQLNYLLKLLESRCYV